MLHLKELQAPQPEAQTLCEFIDWRVDWNFSSVMLHAKTVSKFVLITFVYL